MDEFLQPTAAEDKPTKEGKQEVLQDGDGPERVPHQRGKRFEGLAFPSQFHQSLLALVRETQVENRLDDLVERLVLFGAFHRWHFAELRWHRPRAVLHGIGWQNVHATWWHGLWYHFELWEGIQRRIVAWRWLSWSWPVKGRRWHHNWGRGHLNRFWRCGLTARSRN